MDISFKGKNVLITGGTRGIGADIARTFFESGAQVTITGTSAKSFEEFQKNNSSIKVQFLKVDFSNLQDLRKFTTEIKTKNIDVLINNAGINKIDTIDELNFDDWTRIQQVNVQAAAEISQAVMSHMRKNKWGRIINIASVFGVVSKSKRMAYTASKSALIGLTKTMALDVANNNILVNAVSPGFIDTELTNKILGAAGIAEMTAKVPLQRLGKGSDVANLVIYLCSDKNQFLTGQNLIIDGGFTCE